MNPLILLTAASFAVAALMSYLYRGAINDYADYRAAVESAQKQLAADAAQARLLRNRIDRDIVDGWAAAVAYSRSHPAAVRVRACPDSGAQPLRALSAVAGIAAQPHQQEYRPGAPADVAAAECEARLEAAVIDAAWIEHVKDWADQQSRVSQTPSTTPPW